jgi:hypothetical protein
MPRNGFGAAKLKRAHKLPAAAQPRNCRRVGMMLLPTASWPRAKSASGPQQTTSCGLVLFRWRLLRGHPSNHYSLRAYDRSFGRIKQPS